MEIKKITQIVLIASDGHYLTDGKTYGETVVLPESANIKDWREITKDECDALIDFVKLSINENFSNEEIVSGENNNQEGE